MSGVIHTFTDYMITDRMTWWVILDCGHWYHYTGAVAPDSAKAFPCPSCTSEPTIVQLPTKESR